MLPEGKIEESESQIDAKRSLFRGQLRQFDYFRSPLAAGGNGSPQFGGISK
jgi:hypothetical protein